MELVGYDKIRLHTKDFEVINTLPLGIKPNTKKQGEIEAIPTPLFMCKGEPVMGEQAYLNTEHYNLSIGSYGLGLEFNPSKIADPNTGKLMTSLKSVDEVTTAIHQELNDYGIRFSKDTARVNRVHLTKDREMNQPVHGYSQIFSMLKGKRASTVEYPHSFRIGNRSTNAIFYDKGVELDKKQLHSNRMRAEWKLEKKTSVDSHLKLNEYQRFILTPEDYYTSKYNEYLHGSVFNSQPKDQLKFDFYGDVGMLKSMREASSRTAIKDFMLIHSVDALMERYGSIKGIEKLIIEAGFARKTAWDNASKIGKFMEMKAKSDVANKRVSSIALLEELKSKFAA
jgi:hypothetical protein